MKILLTGSTGYIGRRLLPVLMEKGHHVVCVVRDKRRFDYEDFSKDHLQHIEVVEGDFTKPDSLPHLPVDIDLAYYLIHSMSSSEDFQELEQKSAENFVHFINTKSDKQIIYLSGIVIDPYLSIQFRSR